MGSPRALLLTLAFAGCHHAHPAPTAPPPPGDDARCTAPRPSPEATCVQDCGPPVVRQDDPPPPWRWLTPDEVAARNLGGCPRCLPLGTTVATPLGEVAVEALTAGALVWSVDGDGHRVAVPVIRVGWLPTPAGHELIVVALDDGREVTASAGHPTVDGRRFASLAPGDVLDGAHVLSVRLRPYDGARTYDLLPASPTGAYWADGVLIGSTLR